MFKSNRGTIQNWIIMIVIVLLIAGGIFAWQYWRAPKEVKAPEEEITPPVVSEEKKEKEEVPEEETANWKTYRNEKYGFEVKYPKEWIIEEKGSMGKDPISGEDLGNLETLHIGIAPVDLNLKTIIDIWNTSFYSFDQLKEPSPIAFDIKEKEIFIDGGEAKEVSYKVVSDMYGEAQLKMYVISKGETKDLVFRISSCEPELCDQILSTFRFIK
ncbi:MAG: PsbP-related protein [Patescibacteria group bacterium]|nr:PsbP-related protein [Patescibacteria group bacterium]